MKLTIKEILALSVFLVTGCGAMSQQQQQHNERWTQASDHAASVCKSTYKLGSCYEREVTKVYPEWVRHEKAKSIALLYAYADAAGDRLKAGKWTNEEYENNVVKFVNRLQMDMAEKQRANDEVARQRQYEGLVKFNQAMQAMNQERARSDQAAFDRMRDRTINCARTAVGFTCF